MSVKNKMKKESAQKKIKRGAIMAGVAVGMGATFILSSVISLFSKGAERREERKEKKEKTAGKGSGKGLDYSL